MKDEDKDATGRVGSWLTHQHVLPQECTSSDTACLVVNVCGCTISLGSLLIARTTISIANPISNLAAQLLPSPAQTRDCLHPPFQRHV